MLLTAIAILMVSAEPSKAAYWDTIRGGANCFNDVPSEQWFADAEKAKIQTVRMSFSKWKGQGRDFLIGDADHFTRLVPKDLARLNQVLGCGQVVQGEDRAHSPNASRLPMAAAEW